MTNATKTTVKRYNNDGTLIIQPQLIFYVQHAINQRLEQLECLFIDGKRDTVQYKHECGVLAGYAEIAWITNIITESEYELCCDIIDNMGDESWTWPSESSN